ncbi:multidrug ABC transporter permease [Paenibacillus baekrokdamisoli]|uniref:Multidrug ABC transporter permease n=1 Tax=Paenibacillus baekrokdamisoli TaxID=1712516 RepID=A0A3G9IUT3_9BACL|nr:ABC-2 family transporter protein [Paenibacillus baekrokdamisoli]MBB3070876.1 ABC-2 type transport system permease protein [Paenibacillus baekrokdamisoli]BBH22186.1 multidrug ABC transporter permease [Paenibacillus baekrokdamisoli]
MKWLRMYRLLVVASLRSRMQYKFNFWFSSVMAALINVVEFAMLAVILLRFGHIKGWSLAEAGYLYAVLTLSKAIYRTFASDVHHLEKYLVNGELDHLLLRPIPVLLGLMSQNVSFRIGEVIQGLTVLIICMSTLFHEGQLSWLTVPLTIVVILSGSLLLFGIGLLTATAGFWLTRIEELQNITEDAARTAAQYPLSIYPKWMQGLLLGVIPVAFANYVPSLYILRGEGGIGLVAAAIAVAFLVFGVSLILWRHGLTRYQSTGS